LVRNAANRFLQDRESMKTKTYAGMGSGFQAHDAFATASQGAVQDRSEEHLVSSDKVIVAARKTMERAIKDVQGGKEPAHVMRNTADNRFPHFLVISDMIRSDDDWKEYAKFREAEARAKI
jgi:hypothetical protein